MNSDLQGSPKFTRAGDSTKIVPKGWIEKGIWIEINDILKLHGFSWVSSGKDSCWLRPNS